MACTDMQLSNTHCSRVLPATSFSRILLVEKIKCRWSKKRYNELIHFRLLAWTKLAGFFVSYTNDLILLNTKIPDALNRRRPHLDPLKSLHVTYSHLGFCSKWMAIMQWWNKERSKEFGVLGIYVFLLECCNHLLSLKGSHKEKWWNQEGHWIQSKHKMLEPSWHWPMK